jgi:hypothetical protein
MYWILIEVDRLTSKWARLMTQVSKCAKHSYILEKIQSLMEGSLAKCLKKAKELVVAEVSPRRKQKAS